MASETEICNVALSHIRAGRINSLDDNTEQSRQCKTLYPLLRDQMLMDNPWPFATSVKPLVLTTKEVFGYAFVYKYPVDCLYIDQLLPEYLDVESNEGLAQRMENVRLENFKIPYEVMNIDGEKVIVTNYADMRIKYRKEVTDTSLFTPQFTMTLSYLLAANLVIPLSGMEKGRAMQQDNYQLYESYLKNAIAASINQQYQPPRESDFVSVRR